MVVEHVPLHPSGNPRARHADVRGLYDVLVVEDVVAVGLVHRVEQPSAYFRKDAQLYVFVLEKQRLIFDVFALARHVVVQRIRIYAAACALV